MPIKSAVFDIFPWFFLSWVIKYSFSKYSLASFKGDEKDFSNKSLFLSLNEEGFNMSLISLFILFLEVNRIFFKWVLVLNFLLI